MNQARRTRQFAIRAKCRIRLAWLMKYLFCTLKDSGYLISTSFRVFGETVFRGFICEILISRFNRSQLRFPFLKKSEPLKEH